MPARPGPVCQIPTCNSHSAFRHGRQALGIRSPGPVSLGRLRNGLFRCPGGRLAAPPLPRRAKRFAPALLPPLCTAHPPALVQVQAQTPVPAPASPRQAWPRSTGKTGRSQQLGCRRWGSIRPAWRRSAGKKPRHPPYLFRMPGNSWNIPPFLFSHHVTGNMWPPVPFPHRFHRIR